MKRNRPITASKTPKIEHPIVEVGWNKFPSLFLEKKFRGKKLKKKPPASRPASKVDEAKVLEQIKAISDKI